MFFQKKHFPAVLLILSIAGISSGGTQTNQPTTKPAVPVTTVWYDLGDVIHPANQAANDPNPITRDDVQKLITETVDTDTWKDNGGDVGSISPFGHQLIVTQTAGAQDQIKALLDKIGKQNAHGSTVVVDAYWLRLTPEQLTAGQSTVPVALLNDPDVLYARARATGFDGQAISVGVTHTIDVVTNATPVVAPGVSTYDLTTTPKEFGVSLDETPSQLEGDWLQLAIDSKVTMQPEKPAAAPTTRPVDPNNPPNPMVLDAGHGVVGSSVVVIQTKTAVRLKSGVPTVVAGMTDRPGNHEGRTLCLVVCATVNPVTK
jgi:hypothetical protein